MLRVGIERELVGTICTYRLAKVSDAQTLRDIYAPYVDTSITFETEIPSVEEFRQRIEARIGIYPYIVVEKDGQTLGFAYASRLFERAAYEWAAELSVYLDTASRGHGLGRALYTRLITLLSMQGVRSVHGKVTEPNPPSDRLHMEMGFRLVGIMSKVGFKLGQWRDVGHYEKHLGSFKGAPEPLIPITKLDPAVVERVLREGA